MIIGNIDIKSPDRVSGWCYDSDRTNSRLEVTVRYLDKIIAKGLADKPRPDLEKLIPGGDISFRINFPPVPDPARIIVNARSENSESQLKFKGSIETGQRVGQTDAVSVKSVTRMYDVLVPLGLNCELGWQLNKRFGKLAASLFQWGANQSRAMLPGIVIKPELIFSGAIREDSAHNMWHCQVTNIAFHGIRQPAELRGSDGQRDPKLAAVEKEATISRIAHLREKFCQVGRTGLSKSYILACHPGFWSYEDEDKCGTINKVYNTVRKKYTNSHFLLIADKNLLPESVRALAGPEFFIRYLDFFAPGNKAVFPEAMDMPSWDMIFAEFQQKTIIHVNKNFKFQ